MSTRHIRLTLNATLAMHEALETLREHAYEEEKANLDEAMRHKAKSALRIAFVEQAAAFSAFISAIDEALKDWRS